MPVERIHPCARCKKPLETPMAAGLTGYHGECWLARLRDQWSAALPGSHQRKAIESIVADVQKFLPKPTEVGEARKLAT